MTTLATKQQILEDAGYVYSFSRELYLNRKSKKVFSSEFVEDNSEAKLEDSIAEPMAVTDEWCFYFNSPPSKAVKRDLSAILDQWQSGQ